MKKTFALAAAAFLAACGGDSDSMAPDVGEPNDTFAQAMQIALGTPVVAQIATDTDMDFYKFTVPPGGAEIRFQTFDQGGAGCSRVDTWVEVYDTTASWVDGQDDSLSNLCEVFTTLLPEGQNYVEVGGWFSPFAYTLKVSLN
jgi:hypothetical protein